MDKFIKYVFYVFLFIFHSILRLFIHKKPIEKKYNVSICAIFKDEALYLREWIEFHKIIGVDHFYLYNNNSTDNYLDVLKPYIDAGVVTLIEYPGKQMQLKCHKECILNYSHETKWLGFIDIDEYVVPIKDNNIYSFLKKYERNTGAVKIYWRVFGTFGHINRDIKGLVAEDFTVCYPYYTNLGKCFYNTALK